MGVVWDGPGEQIVDYDEDAAWDCAAAAVSAAEPVSDEDPRAEVFVSDTWTRLTARCVGAAGRGELPHPDLPGDGLKSGRTSFYAVVGDGDGCRREGVCVVLDVVGVEAEDVDHAHKPSWPIRTARSYGEADASARLREVSGARV